MLLVNKLISLTISSILILSVFANICSPVSASSDAEIQQAISDGLAWLADQQRTDGSWNGGALDGYIGTTGLILLKFNFIIMKGLESIELERLNGKDWFDEMSTVIVNEQCEDRSWNNAPSLESHGTIVVTLATDELSTAWALLTLGKTEKEPELTPVHQ